MVERSKKEIQSLNTKDIKDFKESKVPLKHKRIVKKPKRSVHQKVLGKRTKGK